MRKLSVLVITLACILLVAGCGTAKVEFEGKSYTAAEWRGELEHAKELLDQGDPAAVEWLEKVGALATEFTISGEVAPGGYDEWFDTMLGLSDSKLVEAANMTIGASE